MSKIAESSYKSDIDRLIAQGKGSVVIEKFLKEKGEFISRTTINKYIKTRKVAMVRANTNALVRVEEGEAEDLKLALLKEIQEIRKLIQEAKKEGVHISSEKSLRDFYSLFCECIRLYTQMSGKGQKQDISIVLSQLFMSKGENTNLGRHTDIFFGSNNGGKREANEALPLPTEDSGRSEHQEDSQ